MTSVLPVLVGFNALFKVHIKYYVQFNFPNKIEYDFRNLYYLHGLFNRKEQEFEIVR